MHCAGTQVKAASVVALMLMLASCDGLPAFSERGTGNGSSATFRLSAGISRITWEAQDREPFFGCLFGVSLESPMPDPLAPFRMIVQTEIMRVDPRGRISGSLLTPNLVAGEYSLRYLGDQPCDWSVAVS